MDDSTYWWLAAGALIAAELVSGTIYLLLLALGLAAGALAAHLGWGASWQWVCASVLGGGSVLAWRSLKKCQPPVAPAQANHDVNMDIGASVHVDAWALDGTCSVKYRGAHWDAALMPGEAATAGTYTVAEVVGNRLMLKQFHPS